MTINSELLSSSTHNLHDGPSRTRELFHLRTPLANIFMFGNGFLKSHVLEGVQSKSAINSNSPNEGRELRVSVNRQILKVHILKIGFVLIFSCLI